MGNPVKVLGNVFAALLIGGTCYFLVVRVAESSKGNQGSLFDWAFLFNVLLAGVTGVATEALRVADLKGAAYPVYFLHLVVVLVLIGDSPLHQAGPRRLPGAGGRRQGLRAGHRRSARVVGVGLSG